MLKILHIAKDEYFMLPDNIKIPINIFNPFFEDHGSMTYSATMSSKEPVNRRLVDYNHLPGNKSNTGYLIPVRVFIHGTQKVCTMQILSDEDDEIKFNLLLDEGTFIALYGEYNIKDFEYDGRQTIPDMVDTISLPDWDHEIYSKIYPDVKVAFPLIWAENYWSGSRLEELQEAITAATNTRYINYPGNYQAQIEETADRIYYPIVPQPYLAYIIEKLFTEKGYRISSENMWRNDQFINLILLNMHDTATYKIVMVDGEESDYQLARESYYIKNHIPSITVKEFLKELKNKFNIHTFISDETDEVRFISLENRLKEPPVEDLSEYFTIPKLSEVTEYTGVEFLDKGNHQEIWETYHADQDVLNDYLTDEDIVADYTDLESGIFNYGEVKKVLRVILNSDLTVSGRTYIAYYRLYEYEDEDEGEIMMWQLIGVDELDDYITGTDTNPLSIESKVTHVPVYHFNYSPGIYNETTKDWEVLQSLELSSEGNSKIIYSEVSDIGLNFAFYNKFKWEMCYRYFLNETIASSPQAYNRNLLSRKKITMCAKGDNGLVNNCWKNTFEMRLNKGRIYTSTPSFPAQKLFSLDISKKYIIHGVTYMIKNIQANAYSTSLEYDDCELIEV